jgi:hypothetical protein
MRWNRTPLTAWLALLLLGAAVAPAALLVCGGGAAGVPMEGAHCPLAEAMAADCCVAEEAPGDEHSTPRSELPACCYQAPAEPAELPALTAPTAAAVPVLPAPRLAGVVAAPAFGRAVLPAPAAASPPADLCILHAVFLI